MEREAKQGERRGDSRATFVASKKRDIDRVKNGGRMQTSRWQGVKLSGNGKYTTTKP